MNTKLSSEILKNHYNTDKKFAQYIDDNNVELNNIPEKEAFTIYQEYMGYLIDYKNTFNDEKSLLLINKSNDYDYLLKNMSKEELEKNFFFNDIENEQILWIDRPEVIARFAIATSNADDSKKAIADTILRKIGNLGGNFEIAKNLILKTIEEKENLAISKEKNVWAKKDARVCLEGLKVLDKYISKYESTEDLIKLVYRINAEHKINEKKQSTYATQLKSNIEKEPIDTALYLKAKLNNNEMVDKLFQNYKCLEKDAYLADFYDNSIIEKTDLHSYKNILGLANNFVIKYRLDYNN